MDKIEEQKEISKFYNEIYYMVRSSPGKELHNFLVKLLKSIERKSITTSLNKELSENMIQYIKQGVSLREIDQIKELLQYKYNDTDIHPKMDDIKTYISKTKKTTNTDIRKKFFNVLFKTEFDHALSKEEYNEIKKLFKEVNIDEILLEIEDLYLLEKERLSTYKKNSRKRKKIGTEINFELAIIAPKIIEEITQNSDFFTKLKFSKQKIGFFIKSGKGKEQEILKEYLHHASSSVQLLVDLDDENENYFICFSNNNNNLAFLRELLSQRFLKEPLEGFNLMGIPIQVIISNCKFKGLAICEPEWHEVDFNYYYRSIKNGGFAFTNRIQFDKNYTQASIQFVIDQLMQIRNFKTEIELGCYLHFKYLLPMQTYIDKREKYFTEHEVIISTNEFKAIKEEVYQKLLINGKTQNKWKSEVDLFKLVTKIYPDAIYQYRAAWLERQSLDIYIPSLRIAIEYQGQQHYTPIDFFGGEEAFLYRKKLDDLKIKKCQNNGVKLIHWNYEDNISKSNLKRILEF